MTYVQGLRTRFAGFLVCWLWLNSGVLALIALPRNAPHAVPIIIAGLLVACVGTLSWRVAGPGWVNRQLSSIALLGQVMLMVFALSGHPYQVEMHLYFLAALAILSGWLDWRVFVSGTLAIAMHHAGLSLLNSTAVFPGGNDPARVMVHACIVIVEALALSWIAVHFKAALERSEQERAFADTARSIAESAKAELAKATAEAAKIRQATLASVADAFESEVASIATDVLSSIDSLRSSADQMTAGSRLVSEHSEAAALSSQQASTNVVAITRTAGELAGSINEIEKRVVQAVTIAESTTHRVDDVLSTVDKLSVKAQGVALIADTISEIAARTNLLALNASIEAARAGEYGRGFAVVAGEVKSLAGQTAAATSEIQSQIQAIRSSSGEAVHAIDAMNRTIATLREMSAAVSAVVEQQNIATQGIAANVGEAARQTVTASSNIKRVTTFAAEAGQVADFVALATDTLSAKATELQTAVDRFLLRIRAA